MVAELGEVVWIVDLNRQSLDRVVPNIAATRLQGMFAAAGWQVLTVKYGRLLEELFTRPGGARAARRGSTTCPTRSTSGCCAAPPTQLRERLPGDGPDAGADRALIAELDDDDPARRGPQPGRARPRRAAATRSRRSTTPGRR